MQITIISSIYPLDIGGPATFVPQIKDYYKSKGYKTNIVCWSDFDEKTNEITRINRNQNKLLRGIKTIYYIIKSAKKSDFIFINNLEMYVFIANIFLRKRTITKVVGDQVWERARRNNWTKDSIDEFQTKKYGIKIEFLRWLNRLIVKNSSQIIVPSNYLKDLVANWDIDSKNIKVIYNKIDDSFKCDLTKEQAKKKLNLEGKIILSVGRLVNWKGFDELIKLMPQLIKQNKNTKLLIIGDGPDKAKLNKLINDLNLVNIVKIFDKIYHKALPLYYRACDLFVLNSEYEGYSHVLLEAAKIGCKIIAKDIGGNKEFKKNFAKNNVVLVKNIKKILDVI